MESGFVGYWPHRTQCQSENTAARSWRSSSNPSAMTAGVPVCTTDVPLVTTERVRNDTGLYVGTDKNVEHKETCETWGNLAVDVRRETALERKAREYASGTQATEAPAG